MRVAYLYNEPSEDPSHLSDDEPDDSPIVAALQRNGHEVIRIDCTLDLERVRDRLTRNRPEVVFNRVDSLGGSDSMQGAVTLLLDMMGLPYTGCTTAALVATASKLVAKQRLATAQLPTPDWVTSKGRKMRCQATERAFDGDHDRSERGQLFLIKSVYEHASFELSDESLVRLDCQAQAAEILHRKEVETGRAFFAERYIDGREFNLAYWGIEPEPLPPAEIDFKTFPAGMPKIVGQAAKWDTSSFEYEQTTHRFCFPPEDRLLLGRLRDLGLQCWRLFQLRGYARIDFRVDHDGQPWILEINANPCLAPDAGFSVALQECGIAYDAGIQRILEFALERGV
jgi:D-alanine-D-alanine ligase